LPAASGVQQQGVQALLVPLPLPLLLLQLPLRA
jgi:hypothetical protein